MGWDGTGRCDNTRYSTCLYVVVVGGGTKIDQPKGDVEISRSKEGKGKAKGKSNWCLYKNQTTTNLHWAARQQRPCTMYMDNAHNSKAQAQLCSHEHTHAHHPIPPP
jgi:hypothetical protein